MDTKGTDETALSLLFIMPVCVSGVWAAVEGLVAMGSTNLVSI